MVFVKKLHVLNGRSAVAARRALPGIFVLAVACLVLAGCRKEEKPAVSPSSPKSYMKDKAFLGKLEEQQRTREGVMARHMAARRAYNEALKVDPKGEQPATQELRAKMDALEAEYRKLQQETFKTVRERITPKKISK